MTSARGLCLVIDSSVVVNGSMAPDLNALADLSASAVRLRDDGWAVTLVLAGDMAVGLSRVGTLKAVSTDRHPSVLRAIGRPLIDRWLGAFFQECGTRTASLTVTRRSFADRLQYRALRDTLLGLQANHHVPLV